MTSKSILIIEDNLLNLELAKDLLEANGFVVYSAQTAEEGLRMAREISPDLVLMDFGLPGMDGLRGHQSPQRQSRHAPPDRRRTHRPRHEGRRGTRPRMPAAMAI